MQLPRRFGKYVLTEKIAQGGMAEIFKATYLGESGFSKEVVIKRLLPIWSDNPQFIAMLIDEAKALVHLNHPNIVQVFELGLDDKTFFISMEWVEGVDLRKLFLKLIEKECPLDLKFIFYILAEILKGLDSAHQKLQIVHRDISPQNILISFDGHVKVTDFGIAKGLHRSQETTQASVKGKFSYMSPEQARGEKVDLRTDIYAVGILMFELLELRRLFDGINDLATLEQVRESRLPSDSLQRWPGALKAIVLTALQKGAPHRYQTAREFLEDLREYAAKENLHTDARDFSLFLKTLFVDERPRPIMVPAVFDRTVSSKKSLGQKRLSRLASLMVTSSLFSLALGMQYMTPAKAKAMAEGTLGKERLFIPPSAGSIVIDATPKSVKGELWIDGKKTAEFVTPYQLSSIDIEEDRSLMVSLTDERGKKITEKFVLNEASPTWVKTFHLEPPKPGVLRIAARPWGTVTIPGLLTQKETPVQGLNLAEGKYQLEVAYPPTGAKLTKELSLASGAQMICQADFGKRPKLICR